MSTAQRRGATAAVGVTMAAALVSLGYAQTAENDAQRGGAAVIVPERSAAQVLSDRRARAEAEAEAAAEAAALADAQAAAEAQEAEASAARADAAARAGLRPQGNLSPAVQQSPERQLSLTLSQSAAFDSNPGLDDEGAGFSLTTSASLSYVALTPTSSFRVTTGLAFNTQFGPGYDSSDDFSPPLPSLGLAYSQTVNRALSYGTNFSLNVDEVENDLGVSLLLSDLDGDGLPELQLVDNGSADALRVSANAGGSINYAINRVSSISSNLNFSRVSYIDGGANEIPVTRVRLGANYSRQLAPDLSAGFGGQVSVSMFGDSSAAASSSSDTITTSVTGQLGWVVNDSLNTNISLGPSLTFREDDGGPTPGVNLSAGLSYADTQRRSFSLSLGNSVLPSTDGEVNNVASLQTSASQALNQYASASLSASLSQSTSLDGGFSDGELRFETGASLSYQLFDDVAASVNYRMLYREDDDALSHRATLTLSKGFSFVP